LEGGELKNDIVSMFQRGRIEKEAVSDVAPQEGWRFKGLQGELEEGCGAALAVCACDGEDARRGVGGKALQQQIDLLGGLSSGSMGVPPMLEERVVGRDCWVENEEVAVFEAFRGLGGQSWKAWAAEPLKLLKAIPQACGIRPIHDRDNIASTLQLKN
jgi:hypothetical protein